MAAVKRRRDTEEFKREAGRLVHDRVLLSEIRVIHRESHGTYGSPSIWNALITRGHGIGEHRTWDEATQDNIEYIDVFYNQLRRHATLGCHSPAEFDARTAVA